MKHQLLAFSTLLVACLSPPPVTGLEFHTKRVGTPIHLESECYQPLNASDSDGNDFINSTEYIHFVRAIAKKMNYTVETFDDDTRSNVFNLGDLKSLPPFDERYNSLRCSDWCQINGNEQSCESDCSHGILGIPIYAKQALDGETVLLRLEKAYMYKVCADTLVAVNTFFETIPTSRQASEDTTFPAALAGIGAGAVGIGLFSVGGLLMLKRRRRRSRMPIDDGDVDVESSNVLSSSASIESKPFDEELAEEDKKDWTRSILVASY
jgi:hypothetical protein